MKVLVTGGAGFLGLHIAQALLQRGDQVTIFSRSDSSHLKAQGFRMLRGDLFDESATQSACAGMDQVFHVAARTGVGGPYHEYHRTNVVGTRHIINGCLRHGVRTLIYTSTPSVVIGTDDIRDGDESLPYAQAPMSSYQKSKIIAENMVLEANHDGRLCTTALRPHAIWGPGDTQLLPRLIAMGHAGKLRRIGSGTNKISMTYVTNAAAAHLQASVSDAVAGNAYFINDENPVNLWEWLNGILSHLGIPPVTHSIPYSLAYALGVGLEGLHRIRPNSNDPRLTRYLVALLAKDHYFRIDRAVQDFGFHSLVPPHVALERAVEYYRQGVDR